MEVTELRRALKAIAHVLELGEFTHRPESAEHWLKISVRRHAARAAEHLDRHIVGAQTSEDHLAHAACRLLLAFELRAREQEALRRLAERTEG